MLEQLKLPLTHAPDQMVEEFATTAGQGKDPRMSRRLILEEFGEWLAETGVWINDVNEIKLKLSQLQRHGNIDPELEIKELGDLVYVIFGYARAKGYDLMGAVLAIHENNMGRMYQPDGTIKRREDGKIIKNPDYPKVDMKPFIGENK